MSDVRFLIMTGVLALSVMITRYLPFLVFSGKEQMPAFVRYLGSILPPAMMGLLVVYCYRDMTFDTVTGWMPMLLCGLIVAVLQQLKHNMILSIASGTIIYMLLIRIL